MRLLLGGRRGRLGPRRGLRHGSLPACRRRARATTGGRPAAVSRGHPLAQAFLEGFHQVDHLGAVHLRSDRGDLLALDLLVHHVEHAQPVVVLVLRRLELLVGELVDQPERQLQLALPDLGPLALVDLAEVAHLVREVHRVEHETVLRGADEDEAFLAAHHELG